MRLGIPQSPQISEFCTSIEQLDSLAEFSFSVMGDNNGFEASMDNDKALGMKSLQPFIEDHDAFCLGVGDHGIGSREDWFKMTEDHPFWHNHYYPVLGDNGNETSYFYGVTADQATWGRGWVQFKALNNFFNRNTAIDKIEFRPVGSTPVISSLSKAEPNVPAEYPDQLCEYYARRTQGKFTFHIIGLNIPDPGWFTPRSKNFMVDKLSEFIASGIKDSKYDIIIVNAQKADWVQRSENKGWLSRSERDLLMTTADLILCGDDHIYRRQNNFDGDYDGTEAIWMNSGQPCDSTGSARGYLNFHMFDNPPRFTVQYIVTEKKWWYDFDGTRTLQVGTLGRDDDGRPLDDRKPFIKEINGPFELVDWNNFYISQSGSAHTTLTSPANGAQFEVGADIPLSADASDPDGVSAVRFWVYPENEAGYVAITDSSAPYSGTVNLAAGTYQVKARSTDSLGNTLDSSTVTITVSDDPVPQTYTTLMSPADGDQFEVGADIMLSAEAEDPDGINAVRFWITPDGGTAYVAITDAEAPYSGTVNLAAGTYEVFARSKDNLDNALDSDTVTITVSDETQPIDSLLENPSFESGTASWTMGSTASVGSPSSLNHGGLALILTQPSSPTTQSVATEVGAEYFLSVWVNASAVTAGPWVVDTADEYDETCQFFGGSNGGWVNYTNSFVATDSSVTIRIFSESTFAGIVSIDQVVLTKVSGELSGYEQWVLDNGVTGEPEDDDDLDGLNNLSEYAISEKPMVTSTV